MDIIKKVLDPSKYYLYVGGELIYSTNTTNKIKEYVKENYDAPKKNIKGFFIKIQIKDTPKIFMRVICTQITITPKLFIGAKEDDMFQVFTYSKDELNKYGFTKNHIKYMEVKCV